jgi:hypothetical protein
LDTDGDGKIKKEEFVVAAIGSEVLYNETVLKEGFGLIAGNPSAKYFTIEQLKLFVYE